MDDGNELVSWLAASRSCITFPGANTQWSRCEHAAHSCGGSPGVVFVEDGTRFPIESLMDTRCARVRCANAFAPSTGADSFDGPAASSYRTARTRCSPVRRGTNRESGDGALEARPFQSCPAAVTGNDRRHEALSHSGLGSDGQ